MNFNDRITAGDSLNFVTQLPDYPASDGWVLTYTLVPRSAGASRILLSSQAEGDDHRLQASSITTAGWVAGQYSWVASVARGSERYTLAQGAVEVLPDPASASVLDTRSQARVALDNINAYLANASNLTAAKYSIAGRSLDRHPMSELLRLKSHFQVEVAREDAAARVAAGLPDNRRVYVRFGR